MGSGFDNPGAGADQKRLGLATPSSSLQYSHGRTLPKIYDIHKQRLYEEQLFVFVIRQKGFVGILQIFVRFLSKFERFNIFFKLMYYFFYVVSEFCNDFIRSFKGFVKILHCLFFIRFKYGREIFELGKHSAVHY